MPIVNYKSVRLWLVNIEIVIVFYQKYLYNCFLIIMWTMVCLWQCLLIFNNMCHWGRLISEKHLVLSWHTKLGQGTCCSGALRRLGVGQTSLVSERGKWHGGGGSDKECFIGNLPFIHIYQFCTLGIAFPSWLCCKTWYVPPSSFLCLMNLNFCSAPTPNSCLCLGVISMHSHCLLPSIPEVPAVFPHSSYRVKI